jgi:outer membrane protein
VPAVPPGPQMLPETPKAQQTMRIGYVDIARIGSESTLGKASAAKSREKQEKFQARILAKRKQLDKQKAAIEAKISTLTPQQRETKAREFQKKVEEFQKFGMNAEKELQALQEELSKAVFAAIEQAAAEYGKANGLGVVIIKRELLYLGSSVDSQDVTEGLIKLMNEKGRKR